jgi:soluble lytic murein transglycosylase-like protein
MLKGLKNNDAWQHGNAFIPSANYTPTPDMTSALAQWNSSITEASQKFNVDPTLIKAVIAQESSGNPSAVSAKGAKGLMQLMDSTAQDMGVAQVFDPKQNILGGTRYLRELLDKYNGDQNRALASYNAGPSAVDKYNGVPPYPETQNYVQKVSAIQKQLQSTAAILTKEQTHE